MEQTPVINAQFERFVNDTKYVTDAERAGEALGYKDGRYQLIAGLNWSTFATPERQQHPVVMVSWNDAAAYAKWADRSLPTEVEWERAARGGLEQAEYPWGDSEPTSRACHWKSPPSDRPPTAPVARLGANGFGLYDMVGHVWQWCDNLYQEKYPLHGECNDGDLRARRGGAWNVIQAFRLRCANRGAFRASQCAPNLGFRCVVRSV